MTTGSTSPIARCMDGFETGHGDFADYLLREASLIAGCESVATFDRVLLKERGFRNNLWTTDTPADAMRLLASGEHDCAVLAMLPGNRIGAIKTTQHAAFVAVLVCGDLQIWSVLAEVMPVLPEFLVIALELL